MLGMNQTTKDTNNSQCHDFVSRGFDGDVRKVFNGWKHIPASLLIAGGGADEMMILPRLGE